MDEESFEGTPAAPTPAPLHEAPTTQELQQSQEELLEKLRNKDRQRVRPAPSQKPESLTFVQVLTAEIERCSELLATGDTSRMNRAALRSAINEAHDNLGKMNRLGRKLMRSYQKLQEF